MTETPTTITRARTILREMRAAATPGPWTLAYTPPVIYGADQFRIATTEAERHEQATADATLIVVLAGNPAFLDAIDALFRQEQGDPDGYVDEWVERIASAIVSGWKGAER